MAGQNPSTFCWESAVCYAVAFLHDRTVLGKTHAGAFAEENVLREHKAVDENVPAKRKAQASRRGLEEAKRLESTKGGPGSTSEKRQKTKSSRKPKRKAPFRKQKATHKEASEETKAVNSDKAVGQREKVEYEEAARSCDKPNGAQASAEFEQVDEQAEAEVLNRKTVLEEAARDFEAEKEVGPFSLRLINYRYDRKAQVSSGLG